MSKTKEPTTFQIGWAIHQEKRGKEFRNILIAPPGHDLIEFDAAGQEFRWMAIQTGDDTMLELCAEGEDPHSYMGAEISHDDYREIQSLAASDDPGASHKRKLGKLANLCVAEGSLVLTDRGVCCIEQVKSDDLVWDGEEFVSHSGVVYSGYRRVIVHDGVTATPDHRVLVDGEWLEIQAVASLGRSIEPALGAGWARPCGSAVRIVGGIIRRTVSEVWRAVRDRTLRLWDLQGCQFADDGGREICPVQGVRGTREARPRREVGVPDSRRPAAAKTCGSLVSALQQPEGRVVSQLRRARDTMQVFVRSRGGRVDQGKPSAPHISSTGHRPDRQRWPLRNWKLALGYAKAKPREPANYAHVYDITNCGPRSRFAVNGRIVHNSLQYRTSAPKLRIKARVDYDVPMELDEAKHVRYVYLKTYKGVERYWNSQIALGRKQGFAETLAGRRVQVEGDWHGPLKWSMESTMINFPVQGTGGDQKYLALSVLSSYLTKHGIKFLFDLHDGIYFLSPKDKTQRACVEMKRILDHLPYEKAWGFTPPIPMPWDCKVGPSWGLLKGVK